MKNEYQAGRNIFPGLHQRHLDIHKFHRWLPFLLSARVCRDLRRRRPGTSDPRSWNDPEGGFDQLIEHAFHGAPEIAPGVYGIEPSIVNALEACIAAIELEEIGPRIVELIDSKMLAAERADLALQVFAQFQQFLAAAAQRGEDLLVIWA